MHNLFAGSKDVIGFLIRLPPDTGEDENGKEDTAIDTYAVGTSAKKEEKLRPLPGSEIIFYKNGVSQGVAFKDIYAGMLL